MAEPSELRPRAAIFGVAGPHLSEAERRFLVDADPLGFILFARNCIEPAQVRSLCGDLRAAVGRQDAPILIDQEGGRVARLRPPHWRAAPPPAAFGALAALDEESALHAAHLNARLLAHELHGLGITVDCTPVLDIPRPGADPVIGDRAFSADPGLSARLGRAVCEGLIAGGVLPVIKHVPGHGRAGVDSHAALPVVDAPLRELESMDFVPFQALIEMPWAMTAHVVYAAIDPVAPATISPTVIASVIRGAIGFDGLLITDDLCMNALSGTPAERATASLAAGCDVALHCNGVLSEMEAIAAVCPRLSPAAWKRLGRGEILRGSHRTFNPERATADLNRLMEAVAA